MKLSGWIGAALLVAAPSLLASEHNNKVEADLLANYELVQVYEFMPGFTGTTVESTCPEGKVVIGGGVTQISGGFPFVSFNGPTLEGNGWRVTMTNFSDPEPNEILVSAICADIITSRIKPN